MKSCNGFSPAERARAGRLLAAAIACVEIEPPRVCAACVQTAGRIDEHHEDYSRPLSIMPLCQRCHFRVHRRFRQPEAWAQYRNAIRQGWRFPAYGARLTGPRSHSQCMPPQRHAVLGNPPNAHPLDDIKEQSRARSGQLRLFAL